MATGKAVDIGIVLNQEYLVLTAIVHVLISMKPAVNHEHSVSVNTHVCFRESCLPTGNSDMLMTC